MRKSMKKLYFGVGIFLVLSLLLVGFFSGWFGLFSQSFLTTRGSVSFQGVTYVCDGDVISQDSGVFWSEDLLMAGCRLCFVELESDNILFTYTDRSQIVGSVDQLLGDCEPWVNSKGRTRYRFEGIPIAKSIYEDAIVRRVTSSGNSLMDDDSFGYVQAAKEKFIDWSSDYDYCPVDASSFLVVEKLGGCEPKIVSPPVVPVGPIAPPLGDPGIPLIFWYIVGGLVLFVLLIIVVVKSKKGKR